MRGYVQRSTNYSSTSRRSFLSNKSYIGFEARFLLLSLKMKRYPAISSYIQLYHSSRQLHEETCPFAAMVGVAEPRRAHHLGSAEERTPGGHRFFEATLP